MARRTFARLLDSPWVRSYGMAFVLLILALVFSATTVNRQYPEGAEAGELVANVVLQREASANVVIAIRPTQTDREFAEAARRTLESGGAHVLAVATSPAEAKSAFEAALRQGRSVDAVVANAATSRWRVYDAVPEVGSSKCVTPEPFLWPDFLKASNLLNIADQTAITAIIAIGMTMVIITAGIDLSVGSLLAVAAVCSAYFIREAAGGAEANVAMVVLGCGLAVVVCAMAGAYHGVLVTRFRVPAFVVTLGMMMMARGFARWLSEGQSINALPDSFRWLGGGRTWGAPNSVWLTLGLYLVAHVVMSRTVFGRYVYAIGGNEEAARLSGVPVKRMLVAVYAICGALAGLGGIVTASKLGSGDPKYGEAVELEAIAAVVVGGASLMGGRGKVFGSLIGALIISVIRNGMNLTGVAPDTQLIVLGGVLTLAVVLDAVKQRGR